jgi:hypothetical protein
MYLVVHPGGSSEFQDSKQAFKLFEELMDATIWLIKGNERIAIGQLLKRKGTC